MRKREREREREKTEGGVESHTCTMMLQMNDAEQIDISWNA